MSRFRGTETMTVQDRELLEEIYVGILFGWLDFCASIYLRQNRATLKLFLAKATPAVHRRFLKNNPRAHKIARA